MIRFNVTIEEKDGQVWFNIDDKYEVRITPEEDKVFQEDVLPLADSVKPKFDLPRSEYVYGKLANMQKIWDDLHVIGIDAQEMRIDAKMDTPTEIMIKGIMV